MFHKELKQQTWLPWSKDQSSIRQTKEFTNRPFLQWTRHLPDIQPTKQKPKVLVTQLNNTCNEHRLNKQIIQQLKYDLSSPIVVPKYKLIFFWSAKSACTYWKRLLQFIQGINKTILHDPRSGLKTLNMFNNCKIMEMMNNEQWLKAVFVREPRERILSAYLDKGQHRHYLNEECKINRTVSFNEFLEIIKHCKNEHWDKQFRVPEYFYKQMMVGKFSEISSFTERLLKSIGAWNEKVEHWLKSSKHIYQPHATNAKSKFLTYYKDTRSQDLIFDLFSDDYKVFGFNRTYFK
ncbi:unnamed protein product [Mytilus coruscus]|uniref:Carbohydrate sulfotransferase n=1 Tax=Mytilus coruscus TaxID=42192 RepID=A0A6J8EBU9_MYTCO|nr:unnamed protein product [Mytilus coruscus]